MADSMTHGLTSALPLQCRLQRALPGGSKARCREKAMTNPQFVQAPCRPAGAPAEQLPGGCVYWVALVAQQRCFQGGRSQKGGSTAIRPAWIAVSAHTTM